MAALLLLPSLVAIAVNLPAITRSFHGDDFAILVRHRQDGFEFVYNAFRELHINAYYRPFLDLSFFFQQKVFDDAAVAWHVVRILSIRDRSRCSDSRCSRSRGGSSQAS